MSKQDRQGVRKASDIEQKYGLGEFMYNQRQSNQDFERQLNNLGDSLSSYKSENDQKLSTMKTEVNNSISTVANSISNVEKELSGDIDALSKGIFNMIYPVGAIYLSVSATSPATLFGGTWQQITGRFLLAASNTYSAGSTGGEAAHTLTVNEMPSHNHRLEYSTDGGATYSAASIGKDGTTTAGHYFGGSNSVSSFSTYRARITETGGGVSHNNMPPYLAVYVWKRTA